jgi:hypothetical protein
MKPWEENYGSINDTKSEPMPWEVYKVKQEEDEGMLSGMANSTVGKAAIWGLTQLGRVGGAARGGIQGIADTELGMPTPDDPLRAFGNMAKGIAEGAIDPQSKEFGKWGLEKIERARANPEEYPLMNYIGSKPELQGALLGVGGTIADFASDPTGLLLVGMVGKGAKVLKTRGHDKVIKKFESKYNMNLADDMSQTRAYQTALHESGMTDEILKEIAKNSNVKMHFGVKADPSKIISPNFILKGLGMSKGGAVDKAFKHHLVNIHDRVQDLSPKIAGKLRRSDAEFLMSSQRISNEISPWTEHYRLLAKKTPDAARQLDKALYNSDMATAKSIMGRVEGMNDEFTKVRGVLDEMYEGTRATKAGTSGYVAGYFPRRVADREVLNKALGVTAKDTDEITKAAVARKKQLKVAELDDEQYRKVVSDVLAKRKVGKSVDDTISSEQARKLDVIDDAVLPAYDRADNALHKYLNQAENTINKRKFFGRHSAAAGTDEAADALDNSVASIIAEERAAGGIRGRDVAELEGLLNSRFNTNYMNPQLAKAKRVTQGLLLANPSSAFTQVGDIALAGYAHGGLNSVKAVGDILLNKLGKKRILDWDEMGGKIAHEFADGEVGSVTLDKALRYSGFRSVDKFAKDIHLNASLKKYQGQITKKGQLDAKGIAKFKDKFKNIMTDDELNAAVSAIKDGKHTPEVRLAVLNDLLDMQPLSMSNMPKAYLDNPNGRILYTLKSFMMQQLNVVRKDAVRKIASGQTEAGLSQLMRYGTMVGIAGNGGVSVTKDFIKGAVTGEVDKDIPDDMMGWSDEIAKNMFSTIGLNKYTIDNAKTKGFGTAITDVVAPPVNIADSFSKLIQGDVEAAGKQFSGLTKLMVYALKGMGVDLPSNKSSGSSSNF